MPERKYKSREKVDSEIVQGEGSWVIIRRPTWEDFEAALDGNQSLEDINEIELGKKVLDSLVEDWNWVDDDGNALPSPTPEIVGKLPFQERMFLVDRLDIGDIDLKNLPKRSGSTSSPKRPRRSSTQN